MIEIILFSVFFAGIVIGGLIADATGRLPSAEELQAEDRARYARIAKSAEPTDTATAFPVAVELQEAIAWRSST